MQMTDESKLYSPFRVKLTIFVFLGPFFLAPWIVLVYLDISSVILGWISLTPFFALALRALALRLELDHEAITVANVFKTTRVAWNALSTVATTPLHSVFAGEDRMVTFVGPNVNVKAWITLWPGPTHGEDLAALIRKFAKPHHVSVHLTPPSDGIVGSKRRANWRS